MAPEPSDGGRAPRAACRPARLELALVLQRGDWRYLGRVGAFGRYSFKVDALSALPIVLAKLRRRGWAGPVVLLVQQPWGELISQDHLIKEQEPDGRYEGRAPR